MNNYKRPDKTVPITPSLSRSSFPLKIGPDSFSFSSSSTRKLKSLLQRRGPSTRRVGMSRLASRNISSCSFSVSALNILSKIADASGFFWPFKSPLLDPYSDIITGPILGEQVNIVIVLTKDKLAQLPHF